MEIFRIGWIVAIALAVFTVVEFIFASEVHNTEIRVTGVMLAGTIKALLIIWFFMHIARAWRGEGAH
ncbi:MAG: cytochrome C oxidase subunit IV family protein [Dehalococcoidia bacterium]|nr:cytochrome C oxidase subunit IV family protein [Dehalococcoidia bacterium]